MIENKKIAFVASECQPFFTSGGLGDVIGSLPKKIAKQDKGAWEVTVFLPLYSKISRAYANKLVYYGQMYVGLSWRRQYCGIYKYEENGVTYYFIDNEYYFKREKFYGYFDDGERFAFFSKAVIDVMLHINEVPDVIHCHDWQTGLLPVYLRTLYYHYEEFKNVKRVFTIHNIEYQGKYSFDSDIIEDVFGISSNDAYLLEYNGCLNIMKGAIECSNVVSTVSPSYALEIQTAEYAHGLENQVIRAANEGKLCGILNGIDTTFYNPKRDKALFKTFDKADISGKKVNKSELQAMLGLPVNPDVPVIGMVSRLVAHKGLDILKNAFNELMQLDVQLVVIGTGDAYYEGFLEDMQAKYANKVKVILAFNQDLARKIYASSDLFLMPSKSEPCGLSQMIASRYGAVPMIRETGGLQDSIKDFGGEKGNGYTFAGFEPSALVDMVRRAVADFHEENWNEKVEKVMSVDFSWKVSAKAYIAMYKKVLK
ncbi:MAG: glycogen synthase [Bacilli bacterium]|nr:glycogen synthase [Bacilli bacterium]